MGADTAQCICSCRRTVVRPSCVMSSRDLAALVHLVGFTTGALLYAMLGVMTRRRLANVHAPGDQHAGPGPLADDLVRFEQHGECGGPLPPGPR